MTREELLAGLSARGLRVPEAELDEFAALVADMQSAAEVARRPLPYACEPASTFALAGPEATGEAEFR